MPEQQKGCGKCGAFSMPFDGDVQFYRARPTKAPAELLLAERPKGRAQNMPPIETEENVSPYVQALSGSLYCHTGLDNPVSSHASHLDADWNLWPRRRASFETILRCKIPQDEDQNYI